MPREEYQLPVASGGPVAITRGATHDVRDSRAMMEYQCGDCGSKVTLAKDGLVACTSCAGRVLYKTRTKRMVQFEAR